MSVEKPAIIRVLYMENKSQNLKTNSEVKAMQRLIGRIEVLMFLFGRDIEENEGCKTKTCLISRRIRFGCHCDLSIASGHFTDRTQRH